MSKTEVSRLSKEALRLYKADQHEEALKLFDQALGYEREDGDLWLNRANCLYKMGQLEEARNSCDRAVDCVPFSHKAWFSKSVTERNLKWETEAIESLQFCLASIVERGNPLVQKILAVLEGYRKKGAEIPPEKAFLLVKEAYSLAVDQKDFPAAGSLLDKALELSPSISRAWQFKAMCLAAMNMPDQALDAYEKAIDLDGRNAVYWYNKAVLHGKLKQYDEAARCYVKSLEITPDYMESLSNYGNLLGLLKRHEEALECLNKALALAPGSETPWFNKGLNEDALNRPQAAADAYMRFLELASSRNAKQVEYAKKRIQEISGGFKHSGLEATAEEGPSPSQPASPPPRDTKPAAAPDSAQAEAWNQKGIAFFNQKSIHEAIACFDKAIALGPDSYRALFNKGIALGDLGREEEALECYRQAADIDPGVGAVWLNLGAACSKLGRLEEAVSAFDRALEINPGEGLAWFNKGKVLSDLGRKEEAVVSYERALKINPKDINALNNKGTCLLELGKLYDAQACFERVTSLDPKHAFAWHNGGEVLNKMKRYGLAVPYFDKALAVKSFAAPWNGKGESLRNMGKTEAALEAYQKAVEIFKGYADAWHGKAMCEETLGMKPEMIVSLKNFLSSVAASREKFNGLPEDIENARKKLVEEGVPEEEIKTLQEPKKPAVPARPKFPKDVELLGQKYEVIKVLGKGGFGVVYHVYSHDTGGFYALKTFRDEYLQDDRTRALFKKEAQILADMESHPYLVEDYFIDEISGRTYIAMEYVAPGDDGFNTLEGCLAVKPPGLAQSLVWAIQFCHGMEFMASQGIRCHRDIKPANIMITPQKTIKISDFGLAGILTSLAPALEPDTAVMPDGPETAGMTVRGAVFGTPTHMPPEQFISAADCDERSDIYSFGVVLYQMASRGGLPFLAALPRTGSPEAFTRFWDEMKNLHAAAPVPAVESPLFPVISRCLEKDPARRYASFAELRGALEPILFNLTGETVTPPDREEMTAGEWLNKGLSLKMLGRLDEALECYEKVIAMKPSPSTLSLAWSNKGNCFHQKKAFAESLNCYDQAIQINPGNDKAWTNKGFSLHALGRFKEALDCYDKALEIEPAFAIPWNNKSFTYLSMRDYDKAILCADTALKYNPKMEESWINKGVAYYSSNYFNEAIASYQKALEINPRRAASLYNIGLVMYDLKKYPEAIAYHDQAIAIEPRYEYAWCNKGNALIALKRFDEATACLDKAMEINPNYPTPYYFKGFAMINLKKKIEAMKCFKAFLKLTPSGALVEFVKDAEYRLMQLERGLI
ncbi:MAG: tetratricopeptide repeat protein [Thermodesulfobacteriota bacterium]